jgi:hypothetical protein
MRGRKALQNLALNCHFTLPWGRAFHFSRELVCQGEKIPSKGQQRQSASSFSHSHARKMVLLVSLFLLSLTSAAQNPPPTPTLISPAAGPTSGGTSVTITGANFQSGATVNLGSVPATNVIVVNSTTITATTPANGGGTVNVTVTNPDLQTGTLYAVQQPLSNPGFESGKTGWVMSGSGTATVLAGSAHSGSNYAQVTVTPPSTQESFIAVLNGTSQYLPVNPGDVINFGGWAFRVDTNSGDGKARWLIEVTDSNKANAVYVAATPGNATTSSWVQQQASYTVPTGKSFVRLMCQITGSTVLAQANFDDAGLTRTVPGGGFTYFSSQPSLTSISPSNGSIAGGTSVTLTGTNFQAGATVTLGATAASNVTVVNSTTITAKTPSNPAGAANVVVTNPDSTTTLVQAITNRGFESGTTGWVAGGTGAVAIIANSSQAHSGSNYAQLTSAPGNHPLLNSIPPSSNSQYLPVNPGDVITFGGWISRGTGDGAAHWVLQITDSNKANPVYVTTTNVTSSSWTFFQKTVTVSSAGQFVRFFAEIFNNTVPATANFDDAVLVDSAQEIVFNYVTPPTMGWIGPNSGPANAANPISVLGTNFASGATVWFGGVQATNVTVVNSTKITATSPAGSPGSVGVVVSNPPGITSPFALAYTFNPPPFVTSVSPGSGPLSGGSSITISGGNFLPGARVTVGGTPAQDISVGTSLITATTAAHASGLVDVVVTNPDSQSATASGAYAYQQPAPSISAVSPPSGSTSGGTAVVISGANFLPNPTVTFGGKAATLTSASTGAVAVTTPSATNTGVVDVGVINSDGQSNALTGGFSYVSPGPAPTISSISSSSGSTSGGASITINGTNFVSGATVAFGGAAATNISVVNNHTIKASTPPYAPGRVNVTITNPDGQSATLFGVISLLPDPDFESGSAYWQFVGSGSASVNNDPANAEEGNQYALLTSNAGASAVFYSTDSSGTNQYFPVAAGDVISFGGGVYRLSGDGQANYALVVTDSNKNVLTTLQTSPNNTTTPVWVNMLGTYTVPAGAAFVRLGAQIRVNTVTAQARFDDAVLRRMPAGAGYTYAGPALPGVYTHRYDNQRTGQNTNETILTPANVNSAKFGKKFSYPVDGFIDAQPLYVANVTINGTAHNVVYVVTEHDSVYAFDADGAQSTPLWQSSFINPAAGVTTVPRTDVGDNLIPQSEIGIMGTPVIDPVAGTIYALARTKENGSYVQRIHALDIASGLERPNSPVLVQVSIPGTGAGSVNGQLAYTSFRQNVRAGLVLANGVVYFAAASLEDRGAYHGWVLGYDAQNLNLVGAFNSTPNGWGAGIWEGGSGIAADPVGNLYVETGNGSFDAYLGGQDYGDSIIKLQQSSMGLNPVDFFAPHNEFFLAQNDLDLASGNTLLLPDQPGPHVHELIGGGKEGTLYVIDRDALGGYNPSGDTQIVQALPGAITQTTDTVDAGLWNTPTYWNGLVFILGRDDVMKVFALQNGLLVGPIFQGKSVLAIAEGVISSNGAYDPILWVGQGAANALRAFDPYDLTREYYNTTQAGTRDMPGGITRFTVPLVVNGQVYVGTKQELDVYGLF